MKKFMVSLAAASIMVSSTVEAKTVNLTPVAAEDQDVRYEQGIATVENAVVRITPIRELDHGSLQFKIAVFNDGDRSFNFGVENVTVSHNETEVVVLSREELERKAKSRALWSQIGYAALAGLAAGAQSNTYTATTYTPHGTYRTEVNQPGLSTAQAATLAAGGGAIALSQLGLQRTLAAIGEEIVQTTTVDPGTGYGGRIVIAKLKNARSGDRVTLTVDAGGSPSEFTFTIE